MKTLIPYKPPMALRRKWLATCIALAVAAVTIGLLSQPPEAANAAATAAQCNGEQNAGGLGIRCTVTVVNYLTSAGALSGAPASTLTMVRCVGAAGPIGAGGGTCATTLTTLTEPVATVQQCNASGNGGGGVVICTVTITNHFAVSSAAIVPATVYQSIGSVITGPGAPGTFTPVNTPGITSVPAATVGQCNGSGNGGTSVGITCTVPASTMTATLPVNVDQCNGSSNGGGALTTCTATVTNDVIVVPEAPPAPPPPPPSGGGGGAPPAATATVAPTVTPTVAPTVVPPTQTPTATNTPTAAPAAPTAVPSATRTVTPVAPRPPNTGSGSGGSGGSLPLLLGALGLLGGSFLVVRYARR